MSKLVRTILALLVVAVFVHPAIAAKIELLKLPGETLSFVSIAGSIEVGDGDRFVETVGTFERVTVVLESPGGVVKDALQIGAEIRFRNFATMVLPDGRCFSACGLVWVSGARRYMSANSQIGFHAAYREVNGEYRESGVANAEIGSFLTHLGLRIEAIRFFTVAGPTDFLLLTPDKARALGIEIFQQNGLDVTLPSDAPTADAHAARFVNYSLMNSRCANFFQPDTAEIDRMVRVAFDEGNRIVGRDKWIELWTHVLEDMKKQISERGALLLCLEVEASLRDERQPTGIDGPSFACSKAITLTETALCADAALWASDRAISAIYLWLRRNAKASDKKRLQAVQRAWLEDRNACGDDQDCLAKMYDRRIQSLKTIEISS